MCLNNIISPQNRKKTLDGKYLNKAHLAAFRMEVEVHLHPLLWAETSALGWLGILQVVKPSEELSHMCDGPQHFPGHITWRGAARLCGAVVDR